MKEVKNRRQPGENIIDRAIAFISPAAAVKRRLARHVLSASAGGYQSGDRKRRGMRSWETSSGSADAEILGDLAYLRSDSRDLMRKAPLARGAIKTNVTNVVGTGLSPQSTPDVETLKRDGKLTDAQIKDFIFTAEREFNIWANSTAGDVTRSLKFKGQQALVFLSALESGDVFPVRRMAKVPGARLQFALQLIEADRVDNPGRRPDTATMTAGVERDELGAPLAYHILKSHPGNNWVSPERFVTERFPAFLPSGEWNVLHLMVKERPEQTRGVPYLAAVIEPLKQLVRYSDAELAAAVLSAMFTVFVKTDGGQGLPSSTDGSSADDDEVKLGNGSIVDLAPGESVEFADPNRPNIAFDPFTQSVLRQIGVGLEIPFEILIKHFTASYSAAQAALLEAWKFFKSRREWLNDYFNTPVWEAVISEAIGRGYIKAPGFFSSPLLRAAYLGVAWTGPPRGSIDPVKEVEAAKQMEEMGYKTAQENTAELTGGDWDAKHVRRLEEARLRAQLPAPPVPGNRPPAAANNAPAPETDPADQQETS
jgi:lambda family phage portal protein